MNELKLLSINSIKITSTEVENDLNNDQAQNIESLINKYTCIFSKDKYDIGRISSEYSTILLSYQKSNKCKCNVKNNLPKGCFVKNDIFMREKKNFNKIYIPDHLDDKLISNFHIEFGHIGYKRMLTSLSSTYYFLNIKN